jgi:hypothetical protein
VLIRQAANKVFCIQPGSLQKVRFISTRLLRLDYKGLINDLSKSYIKFQRQKKGFGDLNASSYFIPAVFVELVYSIEIP